MSSTTRIVRENKNAPLKRLPPFCETDWIAVRKRREDRAAKQRALDKENGLVPDPIPRRSTLVKRITVDEYASKMIALRRQRTRKPDDENCVPLDPDDPRNNAALKRKRVNEKQRARTMRQEEGYATSDIDYVAEAVALTAKLRRDEALHDAKRVFVESKFKEFTHDTF